MFQSANSINVTKMDSVIDKIDLIGQHIHQLESTNNQVSWGLVSPDTVFTVLTTLFVFMVGIVVQWFLQNRNMRLQREEKENEILNEREQIAETFKELSAKVSPFIDAQIEGFNELYQNTSLDHGLIGIPPRNSTDRFKRINQLDQVSLYKSNLDRGSLTNVFRLIDYVQLMVKTSEQYYASYQKEDDKFRAEFEKLTEQFLDTIAGFVEKYQPEFDQIEGAQQLKEICNESIMVFYSKIAGGGSIKLFYHQIIRKLVTHVVEFKLYQINIINQTARQIADEGKVLSHRYNNLRNRTMHFRLQYRNFSQDLIEFQDELNGYLESL